MSRQPICRYVSSTIFTVNVLGRLLLFALPIDIERAVRVVIVAAKVRIPCLQQLLLSGFLRHDVLDERSQQVIKYPIWNRVYGNSFFGHHNRKPRSPRNRKVVLFARPATRYDVFGTLEIKHAESSVTLLHYRSGMEKGQFCIVSNIKYKKVTLLLSRM